MRRNRGGIILSVVMVAWFLACAGSGHAETVTPVRVDVAVDQDTITIGDVVTYTITVTAPKEYEIIFPSFAEEVAGFAVIDFGESTRGFFKKRTWERWYTLDTYVTGEYTIPPVVITYKAPGSNVPTEIETKAITITVKSVMVDPQAPDDIRDIKGPHRVPLHIPWYVWVLTLGVSLAIGYGIWRFVQRKVTALMTKPPIPAHDIAYAALKALKHSDLIAERKIKEYYSQLSHIIRVYLEQRFRIPAPEMTTEEFLQNIKTLNVLLPRQKDVLKDFLTHSDMVKFAKYGPSAEEIRASFECAERLVDETKEEIVEKKTDDVSDL